MPPHFPPLRAVVFDMDGTLYTNARLDRAYNESIERVAAQVLGVTRAEALRRFTAATQRLRARLGRTPSKLFTLTQIGVSDKRWAKLAARWVNPHAYVKPDRRLRRVLLELRTHFRLAVVTNNHRSNLVATLKALGVADCFDDLLALSDTRLFKPSARLYRLCAERLGVAPGECLSVGDRFELDLAPAAEAGMHTLLVGRPSDLYRLPGLLQPATGTWLRTRTPVQKRLAAAAAVASLRKGRLAVIPTDTVYGLAARPDAAGISLLYRAKGRPEGNPLVLLLASPAQASRYARLIGQAPDLIRRHWPGPLTLVLPVKPGTPWGRLLRGSRTVALRVPDHGLARDIIRRCGGALAVTSANPAGQPAPAALRKVSGQIRVFADCLVASDQPLASKPSAVVKVAARGLKVLRPGSLNLSQDGELSATKPRPRGYKP
ncbi:MAG: L-threonylcarbamoyladenylate synthase [candidate division FCPU426 bacterium]